MKPLFYLFILLLPLNLDAITNHDKVLKIVNQQTNKKYDKSLEAAQTYHIGEEIQFRQQGKNRLQQGEIIAITDNTIIIKNDDNRAIIPITSIKSIQRKGNVESNFMFYFSLVVSIILIITGLFLISSLVWNFRRSPTIQQSNIMDRLELAIVGLLILLTGIFGIKLKNKRINKFSRFKIGKKWKLEVQNLEE